MNGRERRFAEREELTGLVRDALGRRLVAVERLRGGTSKGVYRLTLDDAPSVVLYVWSDEEDFWTRTAGDRDELRQRGEGAERGSGGRSPEVSGVRLFEAAHARLADLGVRVPRLYFADGSGRRYPGEVALVEDVRGGTLEAQMTGPAMGRLAEGLAVMARCRSPQHGKVALVENGRGDPRPASQRVLEWALRDLAEAASRVERIREIRGRLADDLGQMAAGLRPRESHGLIHGELGPDHVLIDEHGEPVLIDIEGTMYFDVEWEHVFLRLRFGPHYGRLRVEGLDEARMRFYRLAQHLSLVAGPLRLLDGDFPDRESMMGIVRHHLAEVLAWPAR
ncbi:phosphotransferase [Nonomuraea terrae]|uniref:phosphotransferase n=1 Tax=Nonomuraea terrae TaxID=2530383 RepID=UPI001FE56A5C|nr:phosphotransferase [Nonomuraea terrae]